MENKTVAELKAMCRERKIRGFSNKTSAELIQLLQPKEAPLTPSPARQEILQGDSLQILPTLESDSAQIILADPPYNIGKKYGDFIDSWPSEKAYVDWCKKWIVESLRILKPNGSIYIMTSTQAMPYLDLYLREQIEIIKNNFQ